MSSFRAATSWLDTSKPHSARMYDYLLGGRDWYPADEQAAERAKEAFPALQESARSNRGFMRRAIRVLASEYGIRQFVDIGTGIPTEPNLHQIAQGVAPECRVVYADHDPLVLEYADVLMRGTPQGCTAFVEGDVRHDDLLDAPKLREVIDLERPVALSLVALLHFVPDEDDPYALVRGMVERLAPGSALVLSHVTPDYDPESWGRVVRVYRDGGTPAQARTRAEVQRFFEGLEMIEPGLAVSHRWRPDGPSGLTDAEASVYAGVALAR